MSDTKSPYSYEELLYARKVYEIASSYRDQRAPKVVDDESRIERARWMARNPVESFYEEIVNTTTGVADHVRNILSKGAAQSSGNDLDL